MRSSAARCPQRGSKGQNCDQVTVVDIERGNTRLIGDLEELPRNILRWTADLHSAIARLKRIDAPIVAAVHGVCAGGTAAFVAGCDIVIASERASFQTAYPEIGFSCDAGATSMLSRRMGPARARRFLLLNKGVGRRSFA